MKNKSDVGNPSKKQIAFICAGFGIFCGVIGYLYFVSGVIFGSAIFGIITLILGIQLVHKDQTAAIVSIILGSLLILYPIIVIAYFLANFDLTF